MTKDSLFTKFLKYTSLNVIGMIGLSCYILADTFFIANALLADGLTALNLALPIYSAVQATGLMLGIGGATKYAVLKTQNQHKNANSFFTQTLFVGIFAGIIFLLCGIFLSEPIAILLGADDTVLPMTSVYLSVILCFSPFFILNNIIIAFVRNDKSPKLSMAAMLIGSLSNIILDYVFIFPLGMGMFGAAVATGIAPIISLGVLSLYFFKRKNQFRPIACNISLGKIGSIVSLGLSSFITEISSAIILILFNFVILNLSGNTGVAAYGIVANLSLVAIAIFTGIAQGIQPLASKYHGRNDAKSLLTLNKYAVITSLLCATLAYAATFLLSDSIIALFNSENNTLLAALANDGIKLYFTGFFFAGLNIILSAFLSAVEKPKFAFIISITRGLFAIMPFILILPEFFGMSGVWLSFPLAEFIALWVTILCSKKCFRHK